MDAKDKEVLLKILKHCDNIKDFCADCFSELDFMSSGKTLAATAFELLQIGELAKIKLSKDAKESLNAIPWDSIYGLRNRIVHGYDDINHTILWETINEDIPVLSSALKEELNKSQEKSR